MFLSPSKNDSMDKFMDIQMQVNLTYACNLACDMCIQFHDVIPWSNPMEIELDDIILAYEILKEHGIKTKTIRVSGGEPTMHPQYEKCIETLKKHWEYDKFIICTNTLIDSNIKDVKHRKSPPGWKEPRHESWTISPDDLGIQTPKQIPISCIVMKRCGRLFDSHGFGPCGNAGPIGRVLGIDPYSTTPVIQGHSADMCKHCIGVLNKNQRNAIHNDVKKGKIEKITKTYREGFEREKDKNSLQHEFY